ncbi:MAG: two-component regulator propeller domain-containing protein [Acidobacteriota bacterium]|nr:two-component regulator propeller domain-containing protein [Acidobacteriota bacterium]
MMKPSFQIYKNISTLCSLTFWFTVSTSLPVAAQGITAKNTADISFSRIPEEVFPDVQIQNIFQDSRGFLWVASPAGVSRFDGYEFKTFRGRSDMPNTLSARPTLMLEDSKGDLWVGTFNGLNRFDPRYNHFDRYMADPDDETALGTPIVSALYEDSRGRVWVGLDGGGLQILDREAGAFQTILGANYPLRSTYYVSSILEDRDGLLWVTIFGAGVRVLDREGTLTASYKHNPRKPGGLSSAQVWFVHEDSRGAIWIGTQNAGLDRFHKETGEFTHYRKTDAKGSLPDNNVRACLETSDGMMLFGTGAGLVRMDDPERGTFEKIDPETLGKLEISTLYEERTGVIWAGAWQDGIYRYNPFADRFATYRHDPEREDTVSHNQVWTFFQDHEDTLWVGTGAGLDRMTEDGFQHIPHRPDDPESIGPGAVNAIYGEGDTLWLGLWGGGFNRMDLKTGKVKRYPSGKRDGKSTSVNRIKCIAPGREGELWIGTFPGGLNRFDMATESFKFYLADENDPNSLSHNYVWTLLREGNVLWVGTSGGLDALDLQTDRFSHFRNDAQDATSLSHNYVYALLRAGNEDFWVGTEAGLNRLNPDGSFTIYRETDAQLKNGTIHGILESSTGHLWLSTNLGLVDFDPATETFRHFDKNDGLQGNLFQKGAAFKDSSGLMYFGGTEGFDRFHPDPLKRNLVPPQAVITAMRLFDKPVRWEDDDKILSQDISTTKQLVLSHEQSYLSFDFTAPNLRNPEKTRFAFRLHNLDREWRYREADNRAAYYTSIPPGSYTFEVKASNGDGVWSESPATLDILIKTPPWRTPWAYTIYLMTMLLILAVIFHNIRRRQMEETLRREKEAAEIANQAKSRFLSNMSHELRTPLNAILGFSQLMSHDEQLSDDNQRNLNIINRSGEHLLSVINDVLEMSKIEAGNATLNVVGFDLVNMLNGLEQMFRLKAEEGGLDLDFMIQVGVPRFIMGDEGKLRQILNNLLSNALKFTRRGGIAVRCLPGEAPSRDKKKEIVFEVEDTGAGIAPEEMDKLFAAFVQTETGRNSQQGTGLGLSISREFARIMGGDMTVRSEVGRGTCFRFNIFCPEVGAAEVDVEDDRRVLAIAGNGPAPKVLVAEDVARNREILVRLLEPVGFMVREAADGLEALDIIGQWQPDLVFLDKRMPVMDGVETAERIRRNFPDNGPAVIALTAGAFAEDREALLAAGCNDFMSKPFREEVLFRKIKGQLGLEYIYEGEDIEGNGAGGRSELSAELLMGLPSRILEALKNATVLGDMDELADVVAAVAELDTELAGILSEKVENFDYEPILTCLNELEKEKVTTSR